jgi:hypothetical protein
MSLSGYLLIIFFSQGTPTIIPGYYANLKSCEEAASAALPAEATRCIPAPEIFRSVVNSP